MEFHDLYCLPNIVPVITEKKRMRWAWHVARMGAWRYAYRVLVGNLRERYRLIDGRIILKWISKKREGGMDWIDMAQDRGRW